MDYFDILLAKKLSGGGGGEIVLEDITITENGVVTAPSGKAYKKITTDVPLPSNAYLLKEVEGLPKDIATFTDGSNLPMPSLKVSIEPIQSGSGEPSPTNIRPIYGYQTETITRHGANMFGGEMELGSIDDTTGVEVPDNTCLRSKALYTINVSGGVPFYGVVPFDYNGIKYYFYDLFGNFISCSGWQSKGVYTPPNDAVIMRIVLSSDYGTTYNNDISINYPSTITTYQSFSGHANFILFSDGTNPLTVYGGKLDVVNGVLTKTHEYIASYNGETLPSTWISDRDVYASGTTPTTGAEVVYELATPIEIQLNPTIIKSLQGANNFFASTGEIERLQYWGKEQN